METTYRTRDREQSSPRALAHAVLSLLTLLGMLAVALLPERALAMAQRTGDFELEMDAPWRIEPRGGSDPYGAIPIQVSIHDADQPATGADQMLQRIIEIKQQGYSVKDVLWAFLEEPIDTILGPADEFLSWLGIDVIPDVELPPIVTLDRFESLRIDEESGGGFVQRRVFTLADIHEVERTQGIWGHSAAQWGPEAGGTPPARPVHSICRRWQGQDCSGFASLRPTSEWHLTAFYTPTNPTPGRNVRLRTTLRLRTIRNGVATTQSFQRFLTIHLAEQPLPKFDSEWAYGDLHYHSQGTDNDGESGYSYRGTVQAMNAMGLDFAFATDHASNSPQIGSARPEISRELVVPIIRGLRDLSPDRFAFGIDLLNGTTGANRQVVSHARPSGQGAGAAASQLFLGAEVDVVPETKPGEAFSSHFCFFVPKFLKALDQRSVFPEEFWCDSMSVPTGDGRELLLDVQGPNAGRLLSTDFFARQHLIHLPVDPQRKSAFIASNTSKYGGGTRRLGEILDVELGQRQKGYVFLAHPFDQGKGDSVGALGPDLISYTKAQLDDAFDSPHVLGLQIWNENPVSSADANDAEPFESPHWEGQQQPFHGADFQKWDLLQLRGLDAARTASLSWLPADHPRRFFAAGGSDAHGDFNYRRKGFFFGMESATDTAIGKPRNLVHVGPAAGASLSSALGTATPLSQPQVVEGLRSGNFAITDGPAVRIVVDVDGNGQIDAGDVPMGGIHEHTLEGPFQIIVEWKSTPEFAPVQEIDLKLGVWADGVPEGMVYMRGRPAGIFNDPDYVYRHPVTNQLFIATPNIPYWHDPNPENPLVFQPLPGEGYAGRRVITIDPAKYPVGQPVCIQPDTTHRSTSTTPTTSTIANTTGLEGTTTLASRTTGTTGTTTGGTTTGSGGTVVYLNQSIDVQLQNLLDGEFDTVPPSCPDRVFLNPTRPDRIFVRAEVRNDVAPDTSAICSTTPNPAIAPCVRRVAYTNPVWIEVEPCASPYGCFASDTVGGFGDDVIDGGGSSGGFSVNPNLLEHVADATLTSTSGSSTTSPTGGLTGSTTGTLSTTTSRTTTTTSTSTSTSTAPTSGATRSTTTLAR